MVLFEHLTTNEWFMNKQRVNVYYLLFKYLLFDCSIFIAGNLSHRVL
jgi:hypothetical protein